MPDPLVCVRLLGPNVVVPFQLRDPFAGVRGTVQPATAAELAAYRNRMETAPKGQAGQVEADFLAAHIKSWNIGDNGQPHPVTADVIAALPEALYIRLLLVVSGREGVELVVKSPTG